MTNSLKENLLHIGGEQFVAGHVLEVDERLCFVVGGLPVDPTSKIIPPGQIWHGVRFSDEGGAAIRTSEPLPDGSYGWVFLSPEKEYMTKHNLLRVACYKTESGLKVIPDTEVATSRDFNYVAAHIEGWKRAFKNSVNGGWSATAEQYVDSQIEAQIEDAELKSEFGHTHHVALS